MRGMILAAGLGERMRPLTLEKPKPCLPVAGRALAFYTLDLLKRAGVSDFIVNLHHLGDQVQTLLGDGAVYDAKICYSPEEEILGTGGGILQAKEFLASGGADEPFVVANSDTISEVDLKQALEFHQKNQALATMLVTTSADAMRYGAVRYDQSGQVTDIAGLAGDASESDQAAVFAGVYIFHPAIFKHMPDPGKFCIVRDVLVPLVKKKEKVFAFSFDGLWLDAGQPTDYLQANSALLEKAGKQFAMREGMFAELLSRHQRVGADGFIGSMARVGLGVNYSQRVLIGARASVGASAKLGPDVFIGERANVGEGAKLSRCVVWDDATVEAGAELAGCVVTPERILSVK